MTIHDKLTALREAVKQAGSDGILLQCRDPHGSEYLPDHYHAIRFFSGFTGENSTLIVTMTESALWCDGRFYGQADRELAGTEIVSMHAGCAGVPTIREYIRGHFSAGQSLIIDGRATSAAAADDLKAVLASVGAALTFRDTAGALWDTLGGRPGLPKSACRLLTVDQTGETPAQRIARVRAALEKAGAAMMPIVSLEDIGWLFCLRASDLPHTPLAVAFACLDSRECRLYLDRARLSEAEAAELEAASVIFRPYEAFFEEIPVLAAGKTVLTPPESISAGLLASLSERSDVTVKKAADPILLMKGVKNGTELKNLRECHVQDGLAVCRFGMALEAALAEGRLLRESDIDAMLRQQRSRLPGYRGDSFPTIAAWGPNAAMMHYQAQPGKDSVIERHGFLLVDSGGQYDNGTTDITRTYPVGPLTNKARRYYTWTLMGHIDMARAVFLNTCTGSQLDILAREPLWAHGIDYRCGTGHGVGFMSSVHEGPQNLSPRGRTVFVPGMTVTDEPGVYEEGELGIRIENELECVMLQTNEYGTWLGFRPMTLVPYDTAPLLAEEMSRAQIDWLNAYHRRVYETLAPFMTEDECRWLKGKTAPLSP